MNKNKDQGDLSVLPPKYVEHSGKVALEARQAKGAPDFSLKQYGFRVRCFTVNATEERRLASMVLLVTLNVRNAFNYTKWCHMVEALKNCFHIPDYPLQMFKDYSEGPLPPSTLQDPCMIAHNEDYVKSLSRRALSW